eukprot:TRINITY_DN28365_c0_g1_i1.p1 TRINITY_DN28365_c0_g1~~TRINITY_DN28365_c0_g1_i1.p1  ORF type:complete len:134 (-),score=5.80 TRINITY_DN28365_c0_g1_i1:9-410(-)
MWGSPKQFRTVWNTHPNRSLRCLLFDFSLITVVDPQQLWPDFSKSEQTDQEPNLLPRNKLSSVASDSATELICQQQATRYSAVSASSPVTRSGSDEKFRLVFFTQRWRGGAQARARNPKLPKSNHARRNFAAI